VTILARALGATWRTGLMAAQLHLLIFFPPFSRFFSSSEWYTSAPIYAQVAMTLHFSMACFLLAGRERRIVRNLLLCAGVALFSVIGILSMAFTFVFLFVPYAIIGAVFLFAALPLRRELMWKLGAAVATAVTLWVLGFPSYLEAMAANSARPPSGSMDWSSLTSPWAWWELFSTYNFCAVPDYLPCPRNPSAWAQIVGFLGAALLVLLRRGSLRLFGVSVLLYALFLYLFVYVFGSGWLGPAEVFSVRYLGWSGYTVIFIAATAGTSAGVSDIKRLLGAWREKRELVVFDKVLPWPSSVRRVVLDTLLIGTFAVGAIVFLIHNSDLAALGPVKASHIPGGVVRAGFGLWWLGSLALFAVIMIARVADLALRLGTGGPLQIFGPPAPRRFGSSVMFLRRFWSFLVPAAALVLFWHIRPHELDLRTPRVGLVTGYLIKHAQLDLGVRFPGYTATVWTSGLDHPLGSIGNPPLRYISSRHYFDVRYGTTFSETDLQFFKIPTFEEYGQWVTRQAQIFVLTLLGTPAARATPEGRMLRIYAPDLDLLAALGVRFVITDDPSPGPRATRRSVERRPRSRSVYLYELDDPNLGTYNPTRLEVVDPAETLQAVEANKKDLRTVAVVNESLERPFASGVLDDLSLIPDGYRIKAHSAGRSMLLLPIQFSNCLHLSDTSNARLVRANFIQTLLVFEGSIDVTMEYDLGLFGYADCGLADARYAKGMDWEGWPERVTAD
jgi:hypothetical protein